ncbi:MAG: hypothetical protein DCC58_06020 [Chloroflexi bacterium]|nr:MAG: hypothetical protein DCC58_06020 [Chloroflexota bacterium]
MLQRVHSGRLLRVLTLLGMLIVGFGAGAGYMAYASTTGDTYYACITSKGDIYRVRKNASWNCLNGDTKISWNQKGQPGPVGPTGPQGPPGAQGPQGEAAPFRLICPGCDFSGEDDLWEELPDLTNAYLQFADLSDAGLSELDFTNADMKGANLAEARLNGTNLTNVHLGFADLSYASLTNAILEDAFMVNTKFIEADLTDAVGIPFNVSGADWDNTTCPDGTNSDTNGDDSCEGHFLPLP